MEPSGVPASDVWVFRMNERNRWMWQRVSPEGQPTLESSADFATFEECVADARRRGYTGTGIGPELEKHSKR
jgi:hypothetical protein